MSDVFTKKKRSEVMSKIRSRGNQETEIALASLFRKHRITGWRRHVQIRHTELEVQGERKRNIRVSSRRLPRVRGFKVRPDFVFRQQRVAVFVDGCFWHGCPKHSNLPVNNRAFWRKKLKGNRDRDLLVTRTLRKMGWRVIRLWEHELPKLLPSRFKAIALETV